MVLDNWKKSTQSQKAEAKAIDWLKINQKLDLSEQECLEFIAWLEEDEANQIAYDRIEAAWQLTGDMTNMSATSGTEGSSGILKGVRNITAIAAVILIGVISAWQLRTASEQVNYQTSVGEQFVTTLDDGSRIHLNTATNVTVDYDQEVRHVRLHAGEAFFDVEKDPQGRPFIVETGSKSVRVVGTQFNIHISGEGTSIDVLEGTVELIETEKENGPALATITQGLGVRLDPNGVAAATEPNQSQDILAWQAGRLDFFADPLSSVVNEFNRYSVKKIIIADNTLKDLPISGSFRVNEAPAFVEALKEGFDIDVEAEDGQFILKTKPSTR